MRNEWHGKYWRAFIAVLGYLPLGQFADAAVDCTGTVTNLSLQMTGYRHSDA